jgi:hypothetical protein
VRIDDLGTFALDSAARLARLFPALRPIGPEALAFAQHAADELEEDDGHVPTDLLERGLALLGRGEPRRLGRMFAACQPEGWSRLLEDAGGRKEDLERAIAEGALTVAICERRARPRGLIAAFEDPRDAPPPDAGAAVGLVLEPAYLWCITDAIEAAPRAPSPDADDATWLAVVESIPVSSVQLARLRMLSEPLRRQLPIRSLPRASGVLRRDLAQVEQNDQAARRAAALLLLGASASLPRIESALSVN